MSTSAGKYSVLEIIAYLWTSAGQYRDQILMNSTVGRSVQQKIPPPATNSYVSFIRLTPKSFLIFLFFGFILIHSV